MYYTHTEDIDMCMCVYHESVLLQLSKELRIEPKIKKNSLLIL